MYEINSLPGETRSGDSSASNLCFLSLESGSCSSSSHLCGKPNGLARAGGEAPPGRYIQLTGWDSHLRAGGRHRFLMVPSLLFPSGLAQLPVTGNLRPSARRGPACSAAVPTTLHESQKNSCLLAFDCPSASSHSAPNSPHCSPKIGDSRSSEALALQPAATGARKSLPG